MSDKHENWTEEDERRMEIVLSNGNSAEHYDAIGREDEQFQSDLKTAGLDIREVGCE